MSSRSFALIAAFCISLLGSAHAEAAKDVLLDHMTGRWVLAGTIDGQKTTHDVEARWILQNTYVQLHEVSREKDASGKPQYEAEVLVGYDATKARYVCFWYDITGVASPDAGGIAQRVGDTLPFTFKSAQGDFRTIFTYRPKSDSWTWDMDAEQAGKLQPFARVTLTKK